MSSLFQVALVLTTLSFTVVNSRTVTKEHAQEFLTNLENGFDENKDGTVTDTELAQGFQNHDHNKDGIINKAEFINYLKQHNNKFMESSDFMLTIFDLDKSGFIELEEVMHIVKEIDQDDNGLIDDAEFDRFNKLFINSMNYIE